MTNSKSMISKTVMGMTFAAMAVATASTAHGDMIQARFDSVSPGQGITYSKDGGTNYHGTTAGTFNWTRTGGDYAGGGAEGSYGTYCIELSQYISYGSTYDFVVRDPEDSPQPGSGMGEVRANYLAELFGTYYSDQFNTTQATAFQTAVWEITHDDGLDLNNGDFRVTNAGSYFDQAQTWLAGLTGQGATASLIVMSNDGAQDHVLMIPAPATLASFGGLIGWFGVSRRRRSA